MTTIAKIVPFTGFAVALALLGGVGWLNVRDATRAQEAAGWVAHTHQVRRELSEVFSKLQDVETGMRGYVLTGAPEFLEPYEAGRASLEQKWHGLRAFTSDNPAQQRNLETLHQLMLARLAHGAHVVQLRRDEGFAPAQAEVASGRGQVAMDAVRAALAQMDAVEARLLADRDVAARREANSARAITIGGSVLSATLLIGVFALMIREARLRRRASLALAESEQSLDVTLHSIGDGVLATDASGRITRLNAVAETLTGWTQTEAAGRSVEEVFHIISEETRQPASIPVADTLAKGTIHGLASHTALIARDGTERPIADSCAPIRNRDGQVIGAVLVFRDVTKEKQAERILQANQRELEAAVRANQLIMEYSLDVICTIDEQGRFSFVSAACEKVWGYRPDELVGQKYIDLVHPEDHAKTNEAAAAILAGKALRNFENRYRRKDGSLVPIEWSARWSAAQETMFCVAHDLTERKHADEALHRALAELSRANAELGQASKFKDEFLANMSHELRTPLNAILGLSEALLENTAGTLTPRQLKSLGTISTSGHHLLALINDILDLSKIEAGKLELHPEPLAVDEFCQSCLAFVRTQATQKQIHVDYQRDPRVQALSADPKRLKQVLVNLLTNAVKFTPAGGRIGLTVRAPEDAEHVHFTVWDTGIGIAPANQTKLFRSFTQIDSGLSREQEGTGLGLALVAKLVELHGGSVALESEPGQGSRFIVTLPQSGAGARGPEAAPGVAPDHRHYRRALIIEDDPTSGMILTDYLTGFGIASVLHPGSEQSIEAAVRERPDVILLDIVLPNESGWVVLARLKEHPGTRDIPVVVVSIVDEPKKSLALGAAAHFTKPVTREELAEFFGRKAASRPPSAAPFEAPAKHTGPVILLAEDNEANIQTIGGYLEDKGYALHYANNGLVAVKRAHELRPALILMDIQMPVMDGLTAIRKIRASGALNGMPIVALTALAMPGDRERCLAAGATDYLSKPVSLKTLAALVERLVPAAKPLPLPPAMEHNQTALSGPDLGRRQPTTRSHHDLAHDHSHR